MQDPLHNKVSIIFCCGLQSETFGYSLYIVSCLYKLNKMSAEGGGRSVYFYFISVTNKFTYDEYYLFFGYDAV
jgi:hypothetical protein